MTESRRKILQESASELRTRIQKLEDKRRTMTDLERPFNEIAIKALRDKLTDVGRQLRRLD